MLRPVVQPVGLWLVGVLGVLSVLALGAMRTRSAEFTRDSAILAFQNGDVQALLGLTDPEEVERLRLSPAAVRGFLAVTLWRDGLPRLSEIGPRGDTPLDQAYWRVEWRSNRAETAPFFLTLILHRTDGWRLNLSKTLLDGCVWRFGARQAQRRYRELAVRYGVRGVRAQNGDFVLRNRRDPRQAR
jgi:hypothetical protein